MASSYTLVSARFPNGTTVYANPLEPPFGTPLSGVVAGGMVTFDGLRELEDYEAHAEVSGVLVQERFRTSGQSSGSTLVEDAVTGWPARGEGGDPRLWIGWTDPTVLMAENDQFIQKPAP